MSSASADSVSSGIECPKKYLHGTEDSISGSEFFTVSLHKEINVSLHCQPEVFKSVNDAMPQNPSKLEEARTAPFSSVDNNFEKGPSTDEGISTPKELFVVDRIAEKSLPARLLRQLDLRILPSCMFIYTLNFLARANIGNAKILNADSGDSLLQYLSPPHWTSVSAWGILSWRLNSSITYDVGFINGLRGLEVRRRLFIIEAMPSCALAVAVYFFLADPETVPWLHAKEWELAVKRLRGEALLGHAKDTLIDWRLYLRYLATITFRVSRLRVQLLSVPPFVIAFLVTVSRSAFAERTLSDFCNPSLLTWMTVVIRNTTFDGDYRHNSTAHWRMPTLFREGNGEGTGNISPMVYPSLREPL
ncbi:hypothetical protein F5146DRAFT_994284 [Armillaria mellea]|nr:hypothetical protein F5146DRAFT_994284 [Armillaria mellea]